MDISCQNDQMYEIILEGLEMDIRLTEFLFLQSTQANDNYHKLITEIKTYVTTQIKIWKETYAQLQDEL